MERVRPVKRRNAEKTKARILAVAQDTFATLGYSHAGIRDIAARADVSSPMVLRYFGTKAGLFEAALIDAMKLEELLAVEREKFGQFLIAVFSDDSREVKPPSIVALAAGDPEARDIAGRVAGQYVVKPLAKWLGGNDAEARALEIISLAMGFVLCTRHLPLIPIGKRTDEKLAARFAQRIQDLVDPA